MILLIFATSAFHSEATSKHIVSPVVMVSSMLVGIQSHRSISNGISKNGEGTYVLEVCIAAVVIHKYYLRMRKDTVRLVYPKFIISSPSFGATSVGTSALSFITGAKP